MMAVRELVFDIFAIDRASATFSRVGAEAEGLGTKASLGAAAIGKAFLGAGVVVGVLGIASAKMAANFETNIVKLETTAGEVHKNLKMVGDGLLAMAGQVGYSATELAKGIYKVESAGYHGADALQVMAAAARGAKTENADLSTVTDAVTSALVDYHLKGSDAARVTNILVAATAHGKTTFEGMASALPNVAAAGASAKITLEELTSAIATMTMHGTDAAKAGTYLRQVIGQLEAPSTKARKVMGGLGIDANKLALTLGSGNGHGLADAIKMIDDGITKHLQPSGLVAIDAFKKSKGSATDFQRVLANLPPSLIAPMGALANMVGGVKSLQGFLQMGGENLKTFNKNTREIKAAADTGGKSIAGFADQQKTLNGKLDDAKSALGALEIKIGNDLLPTMKDWTDQVIKGVTWGEKHKDTVEKVGKAILVLAGGVVVVKAAMMAWSVATAVWSGITKAATAVQWLMNAALTANPIGLVIAAIGLLVGAIYLIATKTTWFQTVWEYMTGAIGVAWRWLWNSILAPGIRFILDGFANITGGFANVVHVLSNIPGFDWAKDAANKMDAAAAKARGLSAGIRDIPAHVPVDVRFTSNYSLIGAQVAALQNSRNKLAGMKGYATGTDYAPGGVALVGESGPELVNLPRGSRVSTADKTRSMLSGRSGGNTTVNINVNGALDPSAVGRQIHQILLQLKRTTGGGLALG
jgi:TP901 family phage tail tape measure protein